MTAVGSFGIHITPVSSLPSLSPPRPHPSSHRRMGRAPSHWGARRKQLLLSFTHSCSHPSLDVPEALCPNLGPSSPTCLASVLLVILPGLHLPPSSASDPHTISLLDISFLMLQSLFGASWLFPSRCCASSPFLSSRPEIQGSP